MPFGFKISLILVPAIMYLDKYTFYKVPYKLFLLLFRTQPDDPRHPVTQPLSLKRRPQYSRSDNILLAYSSSFRSRNSFYESLYPGFPVYLTTIGGRLSFINFILPSTTTINQVIVMVINGNCLITVYKFIEWIIIFSKNVFLLFQILYLIISTKSYVSKSFFKKVSKMFFNHPCPFSKIYT